MNFNEAKELIKLRDVNPVILACSSFTKEEQEELLRLGLIEQESWLVIEL
jgi:hypothetical protein